MNCLRGDPIVGNENNISWRMKRVRGPLADDHSVVSLITGVLQLSTPPFLRDP